MPRFSEEQAQRIFARAAERQHAAEDTPPGFSLDELQEIGQAAGLSPEHIAAAVADVIAAPHAEDPGTMVMGVQTDIRRSRVVPGEMTDDMWQGMVSRFRRTFKTPGITARVGAAREWTGTNSSGGLSNLHVVAAPVDGGTRLSFETSRTQEAKGTKGLPYAFAAAVAVFPFLALLKNDLGNPKIWFVAALFAVFGVIAQRALRRSFERWSETRQSEFDALLDQFELMARADAAPAGTVDRSGSAPSALGEALDALPDAPDAAQSSATDRLRT